MASRTTAELCHLLEVADGRAAELLVKEARSRKNVMNWRHKRAVKNALARGCPAPLPNPYAGRLSGLVARYKRKRWPATHDPVAPEAQEPEAQDMDMGESDLDEPRTISHAEELDVEEPVAKEPVAEGPVAKEPNKQVEQAQNGAATEAMTLAAATANGRRVFEKVLDVIAELKTLASKDSESAEMLMLYSTKLQGCMQMCRKFSNKKSGAEDFGRRWTSKINKKLRKHFQENGPNVKFENRSKTAAFQQLYKINIGYNPDTEQPIFPTLDVMKQQCPTWTEQELLSEVLCSAHKTAQNFAKRQYEKGLLDVDSDDEAPAE